MLLLVLALGLVVGLVVGALGGGGSVLTVPLLVVLLDQPAGQATTASLVIVGTTAAVAAVGHARSGRTRGRTALVMTAAGVPTALAGTALNRRLDGDVLLLGFAVLLLLAAVAMLARAGEDDEHAAAAGSSGADGRRWPRQVAAGLLVGGLTGLFGVGGGFVAVPVLVLGLGFTPPVAVGTSLVVIALNAAVALAARLPLDDLDLGVVLPFTAAAVVAALVGERVARHLPAEQLGRAFAVLLVLVGLGLGVRSGLALAG